jgi:hypothetical protein
MLHAVTEIISDRLGLDATNALVAVGRPIGEPAPSLVARSADTGSTLAARHAGSIVATAAAASSEMAAAANARGSVASARDQGG